VLSLERNETENSERHAGETEYAIGNTDPFLNGEAATCIDPLSDARWQRFVELHPRSSVFHSTPWLDALRRTYGYQPIAYTTSRVDEPLGNAIVFCRIKSPLTGCRLVSLPFSDHCEPLVCNTNELEMFSQILHEESARVRYVEVRPIANLRIRSPLQCRSTDYSFHELDLEPSLAKLFSNFHKSSIQRKIQRAHREGLTYRDGNSEALLDEFYRLLTITRKRHKIPPPPRRWFLTLMKLFGNLLKIRVAFCGHKAIASMITLRHRNTMVYKYGGSDVTCNQLGAMPMLYWNSIQDAKSEGLQFFDLGRTDLTQPGLATFKSRFGARQSVLRYSRFGISNLSHVFDLPARKLKSSVARSIISRLPDSALCMAGRVLYRHIG